MIFLNKSKLITLEFGNLIRNLSELRWIEEMSLKYRIQRMLCTHHAAIFLSF